MPNWFNKIDKETNEIFNAICQHEFIQQLTNGSLDKDIFEFYIQQDSLYLSVYKKVLAHIASLCDDIDECQFYLRSATDTTEVELELHKLYADPSVQTIPSPSCELYTGFLTNMAYLQPLAVALAAALPCYTIYQKVGDYILSLPQTKNNPYQAWINTYGGEEFAQAVKQAIAITERHATLVDEKTREKMDQAFITAAKMEWIFWDSAFKQEKWAI